MTGASAAHNIVELVVQARAVAHLALPSQAADGLMIAGDQPRVRLPIFNGPTVVLAICNSGVRRHSLLSMCEPHNVVLAFCACECGENVTQVSRRVRTAKSVTTVLAMQSYLESAFGQDPPEGKQNMGRRNPFIFSPVLTRQSPGKAWSRCRPEKVATWPLFQAGRTRAGHAPAAEGNVGGAP